MAAFCILFLVVALCLASTASARKQHCWSGNVNHITHHYNAKFICLLQRVLLNWNIMPPVKSPGYCSSGQTFIEIQPCEWGKEHVFVSVIDMYVIFHHRNSINPACKLCSKPSWSCMETPGSTMLTAPLRWGWKKITWWQVMTGDWIPLWAITADVNAGCMGLTKCNCKRAAPVTGAATKLL